MKRLAVTLVFLLLCSDTFAQLPSPPADEALIRAAIAAQADAWNHADIPTFMQTYENSPDTTFIGATLRKGYGPIRSRTQRRSRWAN